MHLVQKACCKRQAFFYVQFENVLTMFHPSNKKSLKCHIFQGFAHYIGDLAGIRTQDPILKRDVLYLLSYQINSVL